MSTFNTPNTPLNNWQLDPAEAMTTSPVIPVLALHSVEEALPIASALIEGGISVLEVTLRTKEALNIIEVLSKEFPDALIGAGTITTPESYNNAVQAGSKFVISPGLTSVLLETACTGTVPLIPGISTISEMMTGMEYGLSHFKFFPAEASGGIKMLKSIAGPFPDIRFCPTGGINPDNALDYLALPNVLCVGGSWLVTENITAHANWAEITRLSQDIIDQIS